MSGRRAAPGGPSYAWSKRPTPERSAFRPDPEVHAFGSPGEFGPSVLVADRVNLAFPALAPQAPVGSAPWAEVKPATAPHPGTRREAREREKQRQQQRSRTGRGPVETDTAADPAPRTSPRGIAVNTTRALVLAGLIAGGYTQVAGMGGTASAEDTDQEATAALGAMVVDVKHSDFVREPQVDERAMVDRSSDIVVARARAAAIAAKKRAEAKARAEAEAKARAAALERATREANRHPKDVARLMMMDEYNWGSDQFSCLDKLWTKESGWNYRAENPSSGAYGIPQALPGSKMISAGSDWRTNAATQIEWGLGYIDDRYGTPCNAWAHSVAHNWY